MAQNKKQNSAKSNSGKSAGQSAGKSGSGAGLVLLGGLAAAAAAGAYFVYGNKEAQKNIKRVKGQVTSKVKGWALKAKAEALEKIEKLKQIDEAAYHNVINTVMKKYNNVKSIDTSEVEAIAKELRGHWKNIKKEFAVTAVKAKKTAKKVAKTAVRVAEDAKKAVTK